MEMACDYGNGAHRDHKALHHDLLDTEEYEQEFCKDTICPHFNFSCKCPECKYVTKNLI